MKTVIANDAFAKLGTALGIATALFASVEIALLLFGVTRQPPYYLVALFMAAVVCSEVGRIRR